MKMKFLAGLVTGILFLSTAGIVHATLLDLPDIDGLGYFYDTDTGRIYMDLDNYAGMTRSEVAAALEGTGYKISSEWLLGTLAMNAIYDNDPEVSWEQNAKNHLNYLQEIMYRASRPAIFDGYTLSNYSEVYSNDGTLLGIQESFICGYYSTLSYPFNDPTRGRLAVDGWNYEYDNTLDDYVENMRGNWCIVKVTTAPIPEPATMLLFGTGLAGLAISRVRKKEK